MKIIREIFSLNPEQKRHVTRKKMKNERFLCAHCTRVVPEDNASKRDTAQCRSEAKLVNPISNVIKRPNLSFSLFQQPHTKYISSVRHRLLGFFAPLRILKSHSVYLFSTIGPRTRPAFASVGCPICTPPTRWPTIQDRGRKSSRKLI